MQSPWQTPQYPGAPPEPAQHPLAPMNPGPSAPQPLSALGAVRFVFEGDWKPTILYGMLLVIIPIVGPIVLNGFLCEAIQRLVRRHPQPLPKFDFGDFGHYLSRGVTPFVVGLLVSLPFVFVIYGLTAVTVFGAIFAVRATGEQLIGIAIGAGAALILIVFSLFMMVMMNAAQTRAELTEDLGKSLSFGEIWSYASATWAKVFVKMITFGFVGLGIALLGMLACYIGLYPAIVIIQIAAMHLRWQIYEQYLASGGRPIDLKAPQWLPSELQRAQPGYAR